MPGLMVQLSFQRALLVNGRRTRPITLASMIEVGGSIALLYLTTRPMNMVGVMGAALALFIGRACANAYLFIPYFQELRKNRT